MKIAGWILIVFGLLSFLGASLKGNGLIGPITFIGLGIFLLYRARNKENEESSEKKDAIQSHEIEHLNKTPEPKQNIEVPKGYVTIKDIQKELTIEQRESAICLIGFFAGGEDDSMANSEVSQAILDQASKFFGVPYTLSSFMFLVMRYGDADKLIDNVVSIKPRLAKEFVLLSCYDLTKFSQNENLYYFLQKIAEEMGYDHSKFTELISQYK